MAGEFTFVVCYPQLDPEGHAKRAVRRVYGILVFVGLTCDFTHTVFTDNSGIIDVGHRLQLLVVSVSINLIVRFCYLRFLLQRCLGVVCGGTRI